MQYWRQLSESDQKNVLSKAEKFFSSFVTPSEVRQNLPTKDYAKFRRLAEKQLASVFDLPPGWSARAREGLLGSLIICAVDEEKCGQPHPDQQVAEFYTLLIRES